MESFEFNIQWFKAIKTLKTAEARDKVFCAICELETSGELSDDDPIRRASTARGIFQMIELEIQNERQKTENKRIMQSKGGKNSAKTRQSKAQVEAPELPLTIDEPTSTEMKLPQPTSTRARSLSYNNGTNNLVTTDNIGNNACARKKSWELIIESNVNKLNLAPVQSKLMDWYKYLETRPDTKDQLQEYPILCTLKLLRDTCHGDFKLIELVLNETISNGWKSITAERINKTVNKYGTTNTNNGYPKGRGEQLADQTADILTQLAGGFASQIPQGVDVARGNLIDTPANLNPVPD